MSGRWLQPQTLKTLEVAYDGKTAKPESPPEFSADKPFVVPFGTPARNLEVTLNLPVRPGDQTTKPQEVKVDWSIRLQPSKWALEGLQDFNDTAVTTDLKQHSPALRILGSEQMVQHFISLISTDRDEFLMRSHGSVTGPAAPEKTDERRTTFQDRLQLPGKDITPKDQPLFSLGEPYAIYYREIFFHIPFLIADALNGNQQFEHARKWYQFILDPTRRTGKMEKDGMWRYLPFRGHTIESLKEALLDEAHHDELAEDAFDPDAIAQLRLGAYEKAVAMKYLDNLLDWGRQALRPGHLGGDQPCRVALRQCAQPTRTKAATPVAGDSRAWKSN